MNKKLAQFCTLNGLTVEGNCAHGVIRGFETNILWVQMATFPVCVHISFYGQAEQRSAVENGVRKLAIPYSNFAMDRCGLTLQLTDMLTIGRLLKRMPAIFNDVFSLLESVVARGYEFCPVCGARLDEKPSRQFNIDGSLVSMHEECVGDINRAIEKENADFEVAPRNYLKGFGGVLIGALCGVVITVVLSLLGFISALSTIISMAVGTLLYRKFGGRPDKIMILMVTLTTLVLIELSVFVIYVVVAGIAAANAGLNITGLEALTILLQDSEIATGFYSDLVLTFLFSAVGAVVEIIVLAKQIKRSTTIK